MAWSLRRQQILDRMAADQIVAVMELTTEKQMSNLYKLGRNMVALSNAVGNALTGNKEKN